MEETTAEYAAESLVAPVPLRVRPRVTVACKTDLGRVRENNEDKFEYYLPENEGQLASRGQIFCVCDGMGGHAAGQIASELTAKTFIEVYLGHPAEDPRAAMQAAVTAANRFVYDIGKAVPSRRGMGTTLSALILLQDAAYTVQVGDSRVYRLREGAMRALTLDHAWVDEALRSGMIQPEDAVNHPYKHVLTRAIGTENAVLADIEKHDLREGDLFLLCSDGLLNHVSDAEIEKVLLSESPAPAAWKLVAAAMLDGGSDNCTVVVVRVDALEAGEGA